jgi:hypothetical protein
MIYIDGGVAMQSRMEKYYSNNNDLERSRKNNKLYEDINDSTPSTSVTLMDNVSEIDISKIKEMLSNREDYQRVKKYQDIVKKDDDEEEKTEYDIYEDIENKIYDINSILEEARSKRETNDERENRRKLKSTQYNILSKLDLKAMDEEDIKEKEEMVSDFFTNDKDITKLIEKSVVEEKEEATEMTTTDLFASLKSTEDTIMTEPIINSDETKDEKIELEDTVEEKQADTFYTNVMSFTKEDFEELHNLHTTVKSNNRLIRGLILVLIIIMLAIGTYVLMNFM